MHKAVLLSGLLLIAGGAMHAQVFRLASQGAVLVEGNGTLRKSDSTVLRYSGLRTSNWSAAAQNHSYQADTAILYARTNTSVAARKMDIYTYDTGGRQVWHLQRDSPYSAAAAVTSSDSIAYDAAGNVSEGFGYTRIASGRVRTFYATFFYTPSNQLQWVENRGYDTSGNQTSGSTGSYHYNASGMIDSSTSAVYYSGLGYTSGTVTIATFDATGRRILVRTRDFVGNSLSMTRQAYDASGLNTSDTIFGWNVAYNKWVRTQLNLKTYDAAQRLVRDSVLSFDGTNGILQTIVVRKTVIVGTDTTESIQTAWTVTNGVPTTTWSSGRSRFTYNSHHNPDVKTYERSSSTNPTWQMGVSLGLVRYWYDSVAAVPPVPTSAPGAVAFAGVRVSPVPTAGPLLVTLDVAGASSPTAIALYDMQGRLVRMTSTTGQITELDLRALAVGSYLLCVQGTSGRYQQLVVKE